MRINLPCIFIGYCKRVIQIVSVFYRHTEYSSCFYLRHYCYGTVCHLVFGYSLSEIFLHCMLYLFIYCKNYIIAVLSVNLLFILERHFRSSCVCCRYKTTRYSFQI